MTESALSPELAFNQAIERYNAGEGPETLLPLFKEIAEQSPKNATVWACLAWLYLLDDKPPLAFKAAQKSVKIDGYHPQARVNYALAMLANKRSGVREQVELAAQMMSFDQEIAQSVRDNLEDGLKRKPDWKDIERIQKWLAE
jgi:predicted Zn-dependent protease